jgi:hypothetical protein
MVDVKKKFEEFINKAKKLKDEEVKRKCKEFEEFIQAVKKGMDDRENLKYKGFMEFISTVKKEIEKEVKNLDPKEKKIFELLSEKGEEKVNIFEAFGIREPLYRDILVWLLDPEGSHGLEKKFAKIFLDYIAEKKGDTEGKTEKLLGEALRGLKVKPEVNGIDFVLYNKNFFCAVEMKIGAGEGENQTKGYENKFTKENNRFKDKERKFFIYLDPKLDPTIDPKLDPDPNKKNHPSSEAFKRMDWWELSLLLLELYLELYEKKDIKQFIKDLIGQFVYQNLKDIIRYFHNQDKIERKLRLWKLAEGGSHE